MSDTGGCNDHDDGVGALAATLISGWEQEAANVTGRFLDRLMACAPHRFIADPETSTVICAYKTGDTPADRKYWTHDLDLHVLQWQEELRHVLREKMGLPYTHSFTSKEQYQRGLETGEETPMNVDVEELLQAPHLPGSRSQFQTLEPPAQFIRSTLNCPNLDRDEFPDGCGLTKFSAPFRQAIDPQDHYSLQEQSLLVDLQRAMVLKAREVLGAPLNTDFVLKAPMSDAEWEAWEEEHAFSVHTENLMPEESGTPHFRVRHAGLAFLFRHADTGRWTIKVFPTTFSMAKMVRDGDIKEYDYISESCPRRSNKK